MRSENWSTKPAKPSIQRYQPRLAIAPLDAVNAAPNLSDRQDAEKELLVGDAGEPPRDGRVAAFPFPQF